MSLNAEQLQALREVVGKIKEDPTLAHGPELAFFKEFVASWGATVPSTKKEEPKAEEAKRQDAQPEAKLVEEDPVSDDELLTLDEEDPEKLAEDSEPFPEKGALGEIELSDEQWTNRAR